MQNKPYHYMGKLDVDTGPLLSYLTEHIVPLFENIEYKSKISDIGKKQQFKPIWLDKNWQPSNGLSDLFKRYVVPFHYGDGVSLFVLGGAELWNMFPEVFYFPKTYSWYEKFKPFEVRPQLVISDSTTSIHKDYDRNCAFNTFLYNTDCSVTEYYADNKKIADIVYQPGDTYLLDVSQPHRVKHLKPVLRIALSWGYKCSFNDAVSFIEG